MSREVKLGGTNLMGFPQGTSNITWSTYTQLTKVVLDSEEFEYYESLRKECLSLIESTKGIEDRYLNDKLDSIKNILAYFSIKRLS
jgi:hypothetical protein